MRFIINALLCYTLCLSVAWPCTTFVLKDEKGNTYFARNLDWHWEDGLVVVNPRGLKKTAFLMSEKSPAAWTAKYGSVTFNQFGREMPFGGMNEAGLVVENMWLDGTEYPAADARPATSLLQWIQYQLDSCKTVEEVIASDSVLRIETPPPSVKNQPRVHYLVCDASGQVATIEFLEGKMVVHRGKDLPCPALANSTYSASTDFVRQHPDQADGKGRAKNESSLARFAHAAGRVKTWRPGSTEATVGYGFDTLDQVSQKDFTVWSVVYDVAGRQIHFRTRSNPRERTVVFKELSFAASSAPQFVDVKLGPVDGRLSFLELTEARHREYLEHFYNMPSMKETMGDLSPLVEGLLMTLRSYVPAGQAPSTPASHPSGS
jgi:choloylglycine hydrolase